MESEVLSILKQIEDFLSGIVAGVATISIIVGAVMMMSTDAKKIETGKNTIKMSAFALAIALLAGRIVDWVQGLI